MPTTRLNIHPFVIRLCRFLLLLGIGIGIMGLVFFFIPREHLVPQLSLGTAYAGLAFLAVALALGPMNVILGARSPISTQRRRDIGILAGLFAVTHTIIGLQVHLGGDFVSYFARRSPDGQLLGVRLDAFGLTNYLGLGAAMILLTLTMLSNNISVRLIGPRRWKSIQRWAYLGAVLVALHGVLYQVLEKRSLAFVMVLLVISGLTLLLQILGRRTYLRQERFVR